MPVNQSVFRHWLIRKGDLLEMGAYGDSRVRHLILGSTTSKLIHTSLVPILLSRWEAGCCLFPSCSQRPCSASLEALGITCGVVRSGTSVDVNNLWMALSDRFVTLYLLGYQPVK